MELTKEEYKLLMECVNSTNIPMSTVGIANGLLDKLKDISTDDVEEDG